VFAERTGIERDEFFTQDTTDPAASVHGVDRLWLVTVGQRPIPSSICAGQGTVLRADYGVTRIVHPSENTTVALLERMPQHGTLAPGADDSSSTAVVSRLAEQFLNAGKKFPVVGRGYDAYRPAVAVAAHLKVATFRGVEEADDPAGSARNACRSVTVTPNCPHQPPDAHSLARSLASAPGSPRRISSSANKC